MILGSNAVRICPKVLLDTVLKLLDPTATLTGGVRCGDFHARQHGAALIAHIAADLRRRLSPCASGGRQGQGGTQQEKGKDALHFSSARKGLRHEGPES